MCVYCGRVGRITDYHIPPKSLFRPPNPPDLITVPSCLKCNNRAAKDEEYFRTMVALWMDVYDHPDIRYRVLSKVHCSLARTEQIGFARSIAKNLRSVVLPTWSSQPIATGTYHVDLSRLDRVVIRITKGQFYRLGSFAYMKRCDF